MEAHRSPARVLVGGRYQLGDPIGFGGMGEVCEARDRRLGRVVAVKLLRPDLAATPSARRRFEAEARAAARLTHPNVVTVFDSGEDGDVPYLVMERLPGRTLTDELAEGPIAPPRVYELVREILSALAAAHDAGIVHRDVKPGNVLLTEEGHAKVADFGIAKIADGADETVTGELVATPVYLAPERLAGAAASPRSDLYSVGVLVYEALGGTRPFEGATPLAVLRAIEDGRHASLRELRPDLPARVVDAVERAMAREPAHRFGSALEMAAAFETDETESPDAVVAPTEPIRRPSAEPARHDGSTRTLTEPPPPAPSSPARAPRRRSLALPQRLLPVVVSVVLAALVTLVIVLALTGTDDGPRTGPATAATTAPPARTPTSSPLPAPLDRSIRRLERSVSP